MITRHSIKNGFLWIDLSTPTAPEINSLSEEYGFTPAISEDLASPTPRPRFYEDGKLLYAILHIPVFKHSHTSRDGQEIDFIIGRNVCITVRYENIDALYKFQKEAETQEILGKGHLEHSHIFFNLMQEIYATLFDELAFIEDWISSIEKKIFLGLEREMVLSISEASRTLLNFRKSTEPHKEILEFLKITGESRFGPSFKENMTLLLRILDRLNQTLKNHSEMLGELRETNNSLLSTKENEVMKTLTVLAAITIPASIIASLFNMSVELPFANTPHEFWIILGVMALISASMFLFFRYKKWI